MTFVPHVSTPPVSPRARRLAGHLEEAIDRFRRESPGTDEADVGQALDLVRQSHGRTGGPPAAVAVGLGLLAAAGLAGMFFLRPGGVSPTVIIGVIAGLAGVAAVVALLSHRR